MRPISAGAVESRSLVEGERRFPDFYEAEYLRLFRALVVLTRSPQDAEDLAQEAFVRLWTRWDRVSSLDDPTGYLYRTAMNLYFQAHRRVLRMARRVVAGAVASPDVLDSLQVRDELERALLLLPARQKAALLVTEFLGYDSNLAGQILGIRPGTVRRLVSLAKRRLRGLIEASNE